MGRIVLPIGSPPVIGYLHHAYPLAILARSDAYSPWFQSRYIQLHCPYDLADGPDPNRRRKFNFYRPPGFKTEPGPGLSCKFVNRDVVQVDDIVALVRRAIDRGMYVQLCVDEFEIPGKGAFQRRHLSHELLVYGYDGDRECVDTLGFNARGNFEPLLVADMYLRRAFRASSEQDDYDPDGIRFFVCDVEVAYRFDFECVIEQLEDYVTSENTSKRYRLLAEPIAGAFGLETYECLSAACRRLYDHPEWYDIRPMHILWEHKKCMRDRIRYLEAQGFLDPTDGFSQLYAPIEEAARTMRMMLMKFRVTQSPAILSRLLSRLDYLAEAEARILGCLLETLRVAPYLMSARCRPPCALWQCQRQNIR